MDGLLAILRTELKRNLQNMCHSTVLLLKQLLEQARPRELEARVGNESWKRDC